VWFANVNFIGEKNGEKIGKMLNFAQKNAPV